MKILLVEDEPFIALDLRSIVAALGHEVVGVADSLTLALQLAEATHPEAAFIDMNLRDGFTGLEVARQLAGRFGVRFGFVTGNAEQLYKDPSGAVAVVEKPFTDEDIADLLERLALPA